MIMNYEPTSVCNICFIIVEIIETITVTVMFYVIKYLRAITS